jgi:ribosomal protein S4
MSLLKIKNNFKKNFVKRGEKSVKYTNFYKKKNFIPTNFVNITKKGFRVYDAIVFRRVKVLKRLRTLNLKTYNSLFLKYAGLRWIKDFKLISGFSKYKKSVESLESQGLKRKVVRRRISDFSVALQDKQKLKYFYLGLKEYKLRNIVRQVFSSKMNHMDTFVGILESKLSTFLFRINFSKNFKAINLFIKLGFIKINNILVTNINYSLKPGDIVTFHIANKTFSSFLKSFEKKMSLFYYPSSYIECSFTLMSFIFYKKPRVCEVPYFFNINLSRILYFYNYKGLK